MTGYENHAGFTISGSKLQVVEITNQDEQFFLENYNLSLMEYGLRLY